jgi:hypothetical protein
MSACGRGGTGSYASAMWVRDVGCVAVCALVALSLGCAKQPEAPPTRVASGEPSTLTPAAGQHQPSEADDAAPQPAAEVPTECDRSGADGEQCFPPQAFVEALCQGKYPGVALTMFRQDEPWKHAWVKVPEVMPQNPYDGPVTHAPLLFSEEVVLLRFRPFKAIKGYSVKGPDRYDVLRLSGSCATLAVDEIRYHWRGPSRYAPLVWNWLEPAFQQALGGSDEVSQARDAQQQACGGRYMGGGDSSCQKATDALVLAIMQQVDAGAALPTPRDLPEWVAD